MSRRTARQILALTSLVGFIIVSVIAMQKGHIELVFGAWGVLITKAYSDYFGDHRDQDTSSEP